MSNRKKNFTGGRPGRCSGEPSLNSFDNCIVFTCEEEVDNSLPFLDIYITRLLINNSNNNSSDNSINISTNNSINNSYTNASNKSKNISTIKPTNNSINKSSNNSTNRLSVNSNNIPSNNSTNNSSNSATHILTNNSSIISNNNSLNNSTNNSNNSSISNSITDLTNSSTKPSVDNSLNFSKLFATTIYRKPTYTGLITKWTSFVPHSYKVSTISSMVYRAIKICSSYKLMHEEFKFIENIGIENGYPKRFIKAQIRKTLGRYFDHINGTQIYKSKDKANNKDNSIKKHQLFIDIPFFGKPSEILGKRMINLAKSINPQIHIQPIQRPPSSISKYFPIKDPIPKLLKSNVVYKLNCLDCESSYIGKTIRQTCRRIQEHGANLIKKKTQNHTHHTQSIMLIIFDALREIKVKLYNIFKKHKMK